FWDLPHTRELIANYARVCKDPVRRVVNTHSNGDHCWGNQVFPHAEIIGHRFGAEALGRESPAMLQAIRAAAASDDAAMASLARKLVDWDFSGIELRPPTRLMD